MPRTTDALQFYIVIGSIKKQNVNC